MKKKICVLLCFIMIISSSGLCLAQGMTADLFSNDNAETAQPLKWGAKAPNGVAVSPSENKFILTDGTNNTKELTLLSGQKDKSFVLAPSTGPLAFYADSTAQFQIIDVNDEKSIFYKINQEDYITRNVLPDSMQEYLIETGWETEAGYILLDDGHSNMQSDTVTYSKIAILNQREYYNNADKIGYKDATGLTLRSPVVDKSSKIQVIKIDGGLEYVNTYSSYYSTFPCFYVKSDIFKEYKLISAGENVIKFLIDMYSVPELLEIGYTKDELLNLGISADYPIIDNLNITGNNTVGSTLSPVYDYSNTGNAAEGENVYEWYRLSADGNETKLSETTKYYTVSSDDVGCQIYCAVTPYDTNGTKGLKKISALSDKILSGGISVSYNGIALKTDNTAEITFNFGGAEQGSLIVGLEAFDGYKSVGSRIKETTKNETITLSVGGVTDNTYIKAFVTDKATNEPYVILTKRFDKKPTSNVIGEGYKISYDTNNEVYVLSGINSDIDVSSVSVKIKKEGVGEPIIQTCEFIKNKELLMYFDMPKTELSGQYTAEIYAKGMSEPITIDFYYSSIQNKANILELLNNAKTSEEYANILSEKMKELEISDKYIIASDINGLKFIGENLIGNKYSTGEIKKFYDDTALYSAYYNLSALKTGKEALECAEYYNGIIRLSENALYSDFSALSDENKIKVFSLFYGSKITSSTELSKVFENSAVLTIINLSESYGKLNKNLLKYETYLPFSLTAYKECDETKVSRSLFGQDAWFKTMDELEKGVASAVKEAKKEGGSGGSGSSSRSGSTSGAIKKIEVEDEKPAEPQNTFSMFNDVSNSHWAYENILTLKKEKIVSGDENNLFEPERNITREEFVKMTVAALNALDESAECDFADVDKNSWSYRYIASAKNLGIIEGGGDNTFGSGELITREDMAVIISRAYMPQAEEEFSFADEGLISDYAKPFVKALAGAKIINGFEDGTFRPKDFATRAETAKIICSLIK